MARTIEGLTEHGYTGQTFALAEAIQRSAVLRQELRDYLNIAERDAIYSNERFDRAQSLAQFLADTLRDHA